jgi:caffeoyl-CoA O-methyltransferase
MGMELLYPPEIDAYVNGHSGPLPPLLEELERETYLRMPNPQMLTGRAEGAFLRMLVGATGAKKVVDIGTFTGYSALMMAGGLPDDGELITCEVSAEHAEFARGYFRRSPDGGKVRLLLGPALESLAGIAAESVDFVFLDADKESYPAYYDQCMRILREGGLMAVDNVLWSGRILSPRDAESRAIAEFNEKVINDPRAEKAMLTVRDGVYLIRKGSGSQTHFDSK